jgi:hypothetical protein
MRAPRVFHSTPTRLIPIVLVALGLSWAAAPARANDHEEPRTLLLANGQRLQSGVLWRGCWERREPDGTSVGWCADGFPHFPKVDVVRPGTRVTVRILKSHRPREVWIEAWKKVDQFGMVVGEPQELVYKRRRVRLPEGVAWDFSFTLSNAPRHYYLSVTGVWRDEEGLRTLQDASWGFHLRTSR